MLTQHKLRQESNHTSTEGKFFLRASKHRYVHERYYQPLHTHIKEVLQQGQ